MRKVGLAGMAAMVVAGAAFAQEVPVEVTTLDGSTVAFHVYPFLDEAELAALRLVATNSDALKLFVPSNSGFAAIALSPDDGFMQDGVPASSASAVADLPDAAAAAAKALEMCNASRKGEADCVVVMEIGPAE